METTKTPSVRTETIDPSIENALPENCTMSILFQEDGLVFSILRNDLQKFIVLGEYELKNQNTAIFRMMKEVSAPKFTNLTKRSIRSPVRRRTTMEKPATKIVATQGVL